MKQIIDERTGELIEVEEPNEIAIRELNALDVNFEEYCDFFIKFKYIKEQMDIWEYQNKPKLIDVFNKAFATEKSKTIKFEHGSITLVKEGVTTKVDTDRLKETTVQEFLNALMEKQKELPHEEFAKLLDAPLYDCFSKKSWKDASLRFKVDEK